MIAKITEKNSPASVETSAAIEIRVEGLHKAFDGKRVLCGIDLDVCSGDVIAIVGGSGCGKTVLLNHMLGQLKPDAGRVLVADHDLPHAPLVSLSIIENKEQDRIHSHWGVVFQRNALFSGTVFENIALWLREVKNLEEEAITSIARSALGSVSLPTGASFFDTTVDNLSGGMAKRLAVARALAMDPIVIFYDEPTSGLDPTSAAHVQDLIFNTHFEVGTNRSERTTVIVTHDKDLLNRLKPRTIMLHEGQVFFNGSFNDFAASDSPIIRPYFDLMPILHQNTVAYLGMAKPF